MRHWMEKMQRGARLAHLLEDGLIVGILLTMIGLATLQIILRNLWGGGLLWIDPLLRVLVLWLGLLGAMAASRYNNHITIDVLSRFLPHGIKKFARWLTSGFAVVVCSVLAWHGARFVAEEYAAGTLAFSAVPAWCCELIIPLAFTVMAVRFAQVTINPPPEST